MRHCPDCRLLLTERKFGEVTLDVCSNCAGIWFDNGELRRAVETDSVALLRLEDEFTSPEINAIERPNLRRCPDCECALNGYRYVYDSSIELDMCEDCSGIWVDDGELRKMYSWLTEVKMRCRSSHSSFRPEERDSGLMVTTFYLLSMIRPGGIKGFAKGRFQRRKDRPQERKLQ